MEENEHLKELEEKINKKRKTLDTFILEGLSKDKNKILELSCELDELINEYYRLVLREKDSLKE